MNGAIMKSLVQIVFKTPLIAALLILGPVLVVRAQDAKIQMNSLDHLASKASQTVDVNIDERLMQTAAKIFNSQDPEEREIKKLVSGLKGIYVKSFEFDDEAQYTAADVENIRSQLKGPAWSRMLNVTSKKDGNIEVYLMLTGDQVNGLAVLSSEAKELTVVNIVGPVDLEKLAKLEGNFGVPDLGIEGPKPKAKKEQ
jgi:hypothetical protein